MEAYNVYPATLVRVGTAGEPVDGQWYTWMSPREKVHVRQHGGDAVKSAWPVVPGEGGKLKVRKVLPTSTVVQGTIVLGLSYSKKRVNPGLVMYCKLLVSTVAIQL